jgi:hypothetical protein
VVYDNDLEYGWSRDRENDGNIRDVSIFRQVQTSHRIIALRHIFLYYLWQLCYDCSCPLRVHLPLLLYLMGARLQGR